MEDCENVFHSLQFLLHSELPYILESHRLEVSSPGIEKRLRERWHFEESVGKMVRLITNSPVEAQNIQKGTNFRSQSFTANLISISEEKLKLKSNFWNGLFLFQKLNLPS